MKRRASEEDDESTRESKRIRASSVDHLSCLTDELLLRVLSFLTPSDLCICERTSRKLQHLSRDSALWRSLYYKDFVAPRSFRQPGTKTRRPSHTSRVGRKWLAEQRVEAQAGKTDWKRKYRIRRNWSRGACGIEELVVNDTTQGQTMVADMQHGIIFTADKAQGLRAWSTRQSKTALARRSFETSIAAPTTMATDIRSTAHERTKIVVGFDDGSFQSYSFDKRQRFRRVAGISATTSQREALKAVAMAWPLVLTYSTTQQLQVFDLQSSEATEDGEPQLVHSVQANKPYWPTAVSLREFSSKLTISIAYIEPLYFSGYTVGIQEVSVSADGRAVSSRTANAQTTSYRPLTGSCSSEASRLPSKLHDPSRTQTGPLSLSYAHPYMLVSQPDRTLTLFMVNSTPDMLNITGGHTLWGHSSSVSGAHIGQKGKAVSASKHGDELLIWELENEVPFKPSKRYEERGIPATPTKIQDQSSVLSHNLQEASGWLGFDAEHAVVLKQDNTGRHILTIYDFS